MSELTHSRGYQARIDAARQQPRTSPPAAKAVTVVSDGADGSSTFQRTRARMVNLQTLARMFGKQLDKISTFPQPPRPTGEQIQEEEPEDHSDDIERPASPTPKRPLVIKPTPVIDQKTILQIVKEWIMERVGLSLNANTAVAILAVMLFLAIVVMFMTSE